VTAKLKGYFMLFRILPVMVWSLTGSLVGTALALLDDPALDWSAFLLVFAIAALIQGYPTHIINEIYDWQSGADSHELGTQKSGGSKVLQAHLLTIPDLWFAFWVSHLGLAILVAACIVTVDVKIVLYFIIPGYLAGLFYTLPPFRFAYRPFLGEWLGGFSGIFFLVLGSYYAQTQTVTVFAILVAAGLGLIYICIMLFFHYLDYDRDRLARPMKNTTVVNLGLEGSRRYAYLCLLIAAALVISGGLFFRLEVLLLLVLLFVIWLSYFRADLRDAWSIIEWGKIITYSTLAISILFAALAGVELLFMVFPAAAGFIAHKKFGKLNGLPPQVRTSEGRYNRLK